MLYRIIMQNKNRSDIMTMLRRYFDGFTMYTGTGVYTDKIGTHIEPALIIEIDDIGDVVYDDKFYYVVRHVIDQIKEMNQQDCVLLQRIESNSELI